MLYTRLGGTGNTTIWIGGLILRQNNDANVMRRDFECGVVFVNGGILDRNVTVTTASDGLAKLKGLQAPR